MNKSLYNIGLLFLRVAASGMLMTHGIPKLFKLFSGDMSFADPIGIGEPASLILAVFGEVVFPILIIIGVRTRLAAIPVMITMAVATFIVHANDAFVVKELSALYLVAFTSIALLGPGRYSIDRK